MKFYTVSRLGDHMETTPEGFLLIRDVAIARCGTQLYRHNEVPQLQADEGGWLHIDREPQEVFHSDTLASYEGKPLVNDHPDMPVTPSNWADLAIGHIANIRRGQNHDHDLLFADILVTTDKGIRLIKSGKRAVSVGYDAAYEQTGRGRGRQTKIIANHLALVDEGRCGKRCTILDGKPVFSEDWVDAEPIGPRSPPKVRIHGEVDLEYAADPAPHGPMFRPRPKDPVWTDDWYADIDWKEDQQEANPGLPEPKAQAEAWKAYNEVQKTQHEIGKEQTAQQEEMRAKHEQQRAAKQAEREDKRHGEPKASEAAPAKEDADHVKPPSATQGGSSGVGHDISKALKGALPDLGHMRVRQDKQGKLWVEASTEANSKGNPVTLPGSKGSAGVALKLDPVAKQAEFAEVNNGTATKGLGAKMVEATLKALPKDYTVKASADFTEAFWDKIRQAHPKRFAEDGWTADIDFVEQEHPRDEAGKFAKGSHSFGARGQNMAPAALHGVKFAKWDAPKTDAGWEKEANAGPKINAPPVPSVPKGKQMASGVIVREPDGRTWVIHPTNAHGGYKATMPKGGQEAGLSLRANAIKEAFEESGLRVRLTGHAADVERDTSVARYYHAERIGGTPDDHGWESEKVSLVEPGDIHKVLHHKNDAKLADIIAGKAKSAGSSPQATPASPASQSVGKPSGAPVSTANWKKVGGQLGSNPGAQMTDEQGKKHYVKFSKSEAHAKNEHLAAKLYEAAGSPVLPTKLVDTGNGKLGTATEWTDRRDIDRHDPDDRRAAQEHFATHAWLSNWDAAGLGYDNQAETEHGMTTLDPGGALIFRAMGGLKGEAFGHKASEWDSLRQPSNTQAHKIFGEMSPAALKASAQKVASVPTQTIHDLVTAHGPGTPEQRKALAEKLVNRRNDIAVRAGLKTVDAKPRFAGWLAPVVSRTARGIIVSIMPRRMRDDWQGQPRVSAGQEGGGQWTSGGGGAGLTLPGKIGSGQFHTHPVKVLEQAAQEGYAQGGKAGAIAAVQQAATKFKHAQVQGYAKKLQKLIQAHPETEAQAHAVGAHPDHPSEAEIDAMATQAGAQPEPEPEPGGLPEPTLGTQHSIKYIFEHNGLSVAEKLAKLKAKLPSYTHGPNKAYAEQAIKLLEAQQSTQGGQMPDPFPGLSTGSEPAVPPLPEPHPDNGSQTYLHGLVQNPDISTEQALIWAKEDLASLGTPSNIKYAKQVVAHLEAKLKAGQGAGGTPTPAQEPEAAPAASGAVPAPTNPAQHDMHSALEWANPKEAIAYIAEKMNESPHPDDKDYGKALIAHLKGQAPVESTPAEPDFPKPDENSFRQKMAHTLATGSNTNDYKLQNLQAIANLPNTSKVDKAYVESLMDKLNAASHKAYFESLTSQPEPAAPAKQASPAIPPIPANQSLSAMHSKIHSIASDPDKSLADKIDDIDDYAYGLPSTGHAAAYAKEVKAALKQQQGTASAALHGPVTPAAPAKPDIPAPAPGNAQQQAFHEVATHATLSTETKLSYLQSSKAEPEYAAQLVAALKGEPAPAAKPPKATLAQKLAKAEAEDPNLKPYPGSKGQEAVYKAATDPGLSAAEKMAEIDKVLGNSSLTGTNTQTFGNKWKNAIQQTQRAPAPDPGAIPSQAAAAAGTGAAKPKANQNLHTSANTKMANRFKAMAAKAATFNSAATAEAKKAVPTQNKAWWKKNSTPEQREAIQDYKDASGGINGYLRAVQARQDQINAISFNQNLSSQAKKEALAKVKPLEMGYYQKEKQKHHDAIDEMYEHDDAVLKEDSIFHRGEDVAADVIEEWKQALAEGHSVRPQRTGYTSCSMAGSAAFSSQGVQYEVVARKGSRALGFWAATSSHQGENEVVLRHGSTWEIYEIEKKPNGQHIVRCALL